MRLLREIHERGYDGGYSILTDYLRDVRPLPERQFEIRFVTLAGYQAQSGFTSFKVCFEDQPQQPRHITAQLLRPAMRVGALGIEPDET